MTRSSGVLTHLSTLPGEYSCGHMGKDAEYFIDFLAAAGFSCWQVLPLCPVDEYNSPYQSHSTFAGNPYFIGLDRLYEKGLLMRGELDEAKQKTPYSCEFERLSEERIALLAKAAERAEQAGEQGDNDAYISKYIDKKDDINNNSNKNVDKYTPHILILNGIASTFIPGFLILLGIIL